MNSGNWVYAGTGFKDGDKVPYIVGYEADRLFSQYPGPNAVPGTYTLLSQSPLGNGGQFDYANSSIYQAPSGAWVFASGMNGWTWALDNYIGLNLVDARIQQTTTNIFNLFVTPRNDFSVSASPSSQIVLSGGNTSYNVTITPAGGFTGQVNFSVTGLPTGATATFTPNPATGSATLSVNTSASTPGGSYTLTITGVSGSLTHTTTVSLAVYDFTLAAAPSSQAVAAGSAASYNVTITPAGGFTGQVNFSVTGLPTGATATFTPNPATASFTLSVNTSASTPTSAYDRRV